MTLKDKDWRKRGPTEPGDYWMKDEGGGPTLYTCELIDGELRCGPKSQKYRWPIEMLRMISTRWWKAKDFGGPGKPRGLRKGIYLIIYTDRWGEDYDPEEAWSNKEKAEARLLELNEILLKKYGDIESHFYIIKSMPINTPRPEPKYKSPIERPDDGFSHDASKTRFIKNGKEYFPASEKS